MSDKYTPEEAELVRWFRPPPAGTVERRDGESFADYLSRASIEAHESQMDHEAQARRVIAKVKAEALREAADEYATSNRVQSHGVTSVLMFMHHRADRIERGER